MTDDAHDLGTDSSKSVPERLGPYRLQELLGQGASGSVYAAVDDAGQHVAVKVLDGDAHCVSWPEALSALNKRAHPGLARVLAVFADHVPPFFAMELHQGPSLLDWARADAAGCIRAQAYASSAMLLLGGDMKERGETEFASCGQEGFRRVRQATLDVAAALGHIHELGVVHCDVRPDNICVHDEHAVLLDYGLCRVIGAAVESSAPVGTAAYMAPEQWNAATLAPAVDYYALGVTLFEALTGALPFSGSAGEVFVRKRSVGAPAPSLFIPDVPEDLDALCVDLMRSSPEHRPHSEEIRERLSSA